MQKPEVARQREVVMDATIDGMRDIIDRAVMVTVPCWCLQDECTDAVSIDVEEGLYKSMSDAGVTIITISK